MRKPKSKYIAAVSGGPDSMAMLDKYKEEIVGVCHVNYHKRVDSDYDTKIVKNYCKINKIPLSICDVKPSVYKKAKQSNFQSLAREIRYEFFVKCSKKFKSNKLLVAHNLNDFLETAIMQENRKSKNFFYGIKTNSKYKTLDIFRPLINCFKSDLEQYCKDNGIAYAIDSSNASDVYERNRIRKQLSKLSKKQLLAMYKQINKRNAEQAKIEQVVNKLYTQWRKINFEVKFIKKCDKKYLDSLIYVFLKNNKIDNINYNKIKLVRDFVVSNKSNVSLRLEDNINLNKANGKVKFVQK